MPQIDIQALIDLFKESIGIEAAEKIIYEAVKNANLPTKISYTQRRVQQNMRGFKKERRLYPDAIKPRLLSRG